MIAYNNKFSNKKRSPNAKNLLKIQFNNNK